MQYKNDEVCKILKISPSTLRGYSSLFEKLNYEFKKSQSGHRIYKESDISLLQRFIKLKQNNRQLTNLQAANELLKIKEIVKSYPGVTDQMDILIQLNENILIYQKEIRDENSLLQIQLKNLQKKLDRLGQQQQTGFNYIDDIKRLLNEEKKSSFMRLFKK